MIFASLANFEAFPITLSENLAPTTTRRSALFTPKFEALVPCIPIIPVYRSLVPSNAPLPMRVSHTGASIFSTNSASSLEAPESVAPPPTRTYGLFEELMMFTAFSTSALLIVDVIRAIGSGLWYS